MALHVAMGIGDPERKRATSLRFLPSHPIPEVGRGRGADRAKEDKDEREEWWAAPGGKGGGISNLLGHVSSSHCFRLCLIPCGTWVRSMWRGQVLVGSCAGARWLSPTVVLCDPSLYFGLQFSFPGRQYNIHTWFSVGHTIYPAWTRDKWMFDEWGGREGMICIGALLPN